MKTTHKVALATLAGIAMGVAGAKVIRAQQPQTPPGYVIAEVEVTDPATEGWPSDSGVSVVTGRPPSSPGKQSARDGSSGQSAGGKGIRAGVRSTAASNTAAMSSP